MFLMISEKSRPKEMPKRPNKRKPHQHIRFNNTFKTYLFNKKHIYYSAVFLLSNINMLSHPACQSTHLIHLWVEILRAFLRRKRKRWANHFPGWLHLAWQLLIIGVLLCCFLSFNRSEQVNAVFFSMSYSCEAF